jgi:exonuclease SbcC
VEDSFETASRRAAAAAAAHDFAGVEDAAAALLDHPSLASLRALAEDRHDRRRGAVAVLEEAHELTDEEADVSAARQLVDTAKAEALRTTEERSAAEQTWTALASLTDRLEAALASWEPARVEHATAERLSKLVRGLGSDNQLQMRLSSYVLATRLDQVVDAANERLSQMRDQRYALRRTGRARGGTRAGLGLEIMDAWTDEVRDPCTLSGGETFVVSLALALGLADVVAQESGGLHVETLFIDEGFGMLDPDTLDDVMDRIDALRAGGRTVGVVSHVAELRGRIPTQLHVTRGRQGSTVAVRTLLA